MQVTAPKRVKRPPKQVKAEPLYLWLPVSFLTTGDLGGTNQQEWQVQGIAYKAEEDEWQVQLLHPETRAKREVFYRRHQFLYVKATEAVKARVALPASAQASQG